MTPRQGRSRPRRLAAAFALIAMTTAAATATPVAAQQARPYAGLAPGARAVLEFSGGGRVTLVLEKKSATGSTWGVIPGDGPGGEPVARMTQDEMGRMTAYLSAEGAVLEKYEPHNCERVELLCRYTVTDDAGRHEEQRFSQKEGESWTYSILRREGESFVGKRLGTVRYGADGLLDESEWADLETAEEVTVRRVR